VGSADQPEHGAAPGRRTPRRRRVLDADRRTRLLHAHVASTRFGSAQAYRVAGWALALLLMAVYAVTERILGVALPGAVTNFLLLEHGNLFFAGILFYRFHRGTASRYAPILLGACFAVQFLVAAPVVGLIVACFFVLFFLFLKGWLTFLALPPLLFLGSISFSLYVLHQNIGYVVMRELYALEFILPAWIILGAPLILSIVLAAVFTFCIERPALRFIRQHYHNRSRQWSPFRSLKAR
jgi:peptidoglycan/LPS O-acetylase OafA/YrhL